MSIQEINALLWQEDDQNSLDKRKKQGAEGSQTSEPEKTHPTSEFVIVAKFGDHVLRRLASEPFECDQAGRQTKIPV